MPRKRASIDVLIAMCSESNFSCLACDADTREACMALYDMWVDSVACEAAFRAFLEDEIAEATIRRKLARATVPYERRRI